MPHQIYLPLHSSSDNKDSRVSNNMKERKNEKDKKETPEFWLDSILLKSTLRVTRRSF